MEKLIKTETPLEDPAKVRRLSAFGMGAAKMLKTKARQKFFPLDQPEAEEIPNPMKERIYRWRIVLISIFTLDTLLAIAFAAIPNEGNFRREKGASTESDIGGVLDLDIMWLQEAALVLTILLSVVSLFFMVQAIPRHGQRYFILALLKITSLLMDVPNLAFPTMERLTMVYSSMLFHIVEIFLLAVVLVKYDRWSDRTLEDDDLDVVRRLSHAESAAALSRIERILSLNDIRTKMAKSVKHGLTYFFFMGLIIGALFVGTFGVEFKKTVSTVGEFYASDAITEMNDWETTVKYFGENRTSATKAILIVLDGFSLASAETHPDFKAFIDDPGCTADSKFMEMKVSLPTMSVPNWLCLATGVTADMTGVWGNLMIPETNYDSVFRNLKRFDSNRGITASPWYTNLIKSTLPLLHGDATVAFSYSFNDPAPTADPADTLRGQALLEAITQKEKPYQFFLAHFSDIDLQGHCCGISSKYNTGDTYNKAITNKTSILRAARDSIDNDTVMIIVADHGMLERGGHGGVHHDVVAAPLYIYKRGSKLGSSSYSGPKFDREKTQIEDIAPTMSAIMGVPVPRQSMGVFIDDFMPLVNSSERQLHYYDLYRQQRALTGAFLTAINAGTLTDEEDKYVNGDLAATSSEQDLVDAIVNLKTIYSNRRTGVLTVMIVRNCITSFVVAVLLATIMIFILHKHTVVDFLVMFSKRECTHKSNNRRALIWTSISVSTYLGIAIGLYMLLYMFYGYDFWDSTVLHYPEAVIVFLEYALFPTILASWILIRMFHVPYIIYEKPASEKFKDKFMAIIHNIRATLIPTKQTKYTEYPLIYLFKHYNLLMVSVAALISLVFASVFTFILPDIFRINYIEDSTWGYRFRVLTVMLMILPLLVGNLLGFLGGPARTPNSSQWDSVYMMKLEKDFFYNKIDQDDFSTMARKLSTAYSSQYESQKPQDVLNRFACYKGLKASRTTYGTFDVASELAAVVEKDSESSSSEVYQRQIPKNKDDKIPGVMKVKQNPQTASVTSMETPDSTETTQSTTSSSDTESLSSDTPHTKSDE